MKRLLFPTFALAIAFASVWFVSVSRADHHEKAEEAAGPKLVGVLNHADWCGNCETLKPKLKAVKPDFKDEGVLFTAFDLTDEFTQQQSVLFAEWVGLDEVLKENQSTGFMLLVNPETHVVVGKLTADQTEDQLRGAVKEALASVSMK